MKKIYFLLLINLISIKFTVAQDTTVSSQLQSENYIFSINGKQGFMDKNKKIIIQAQYESITDVSNNLIKVGLNNKIGFINLSNTIIIPFIYEIDYNFCIGARIVKNEEYDNDNKISKTVYYKSIDERFANFSEGLCCVIKDRKYGFIDTLGNTIIPFIFECADNFYDGSAIVNVNNNYGLINNKGKFLTGIIYDKLVIVGYEKIFAELNGEIIYLDFKGIKKID